ncbi:hypothetical protein [uncultured Lactobacillus sp.]|uniref:hypothetical protein n=1 Tax=uncultured Lactobacillus sp. TaxID=153152 RepID=UPI00261C4413|nr:hypothetical protein [uncultured Lactobacillus sp.]
MKIQKYIIVGLASLSFAIIDTKPVQAATVSSSNQSVSSNALSQTDIHEIDQYVTVENNEFVLRVPENANIPLNKVRLAQQQIANVNSGIKKNRLIIDPETKEIVQYSPYTMFVQGAFSIRPGLQAKWFWWGQRSYYSSNAAVAYTVNKYRHFQDVLGLIGHVTKYKIETAGSLYYKGLAWQLESYNNSHKHSRIYMDINWAFVPSFGTW